jgi:tRNA(fMet)-specific endonuclease VapC
MNCALLDTDACIEIIRGNPAPIDRLDNVTFVISTISKYEILAGLKGRKGTKLEKRAKAFLAATEIRGFDDLAAENAATIRIQLETKGQRIGAYDILLAGHAKALNLPIVSGNEREFKRVNGLKVINWREG